jgi:hypothetical protein
VILKTRFVTLMENRNMADEKPTKRTPRQRLNDATALTPPAVAPEPSAVERCPHGHRFGKDCDEFPEHCENCEIWLECNAAMVDTATAAREHRTAAVASKPAAAAPARPAVQPTVQPAEEEDEDDAPEAPSRWSAAARQHMTERRKPQPVEPKPQPPAVAKREPAVPAPYTGGNAFVSAPENEGNTAIFGRLVKLKEGVPSINEDGSPLPSDAVYLVVGSSYEWLKYDEDGHVVDRLPYGNGVPMPRREELDPPPPADPEKERDCWSNTGQLMLVDFETGNEYTFSTSGKWGRGGAGIGGVVRQIREKRQREAIAISALIRLESERKEGRKGFRPFHVPKFPILGWQMPDGTVQWLEER